MRDRLTSYINRNQLELAVISVITVGVGWIMAISLANLANPVPIGPRPEPATWPSDLVNAIQNFQPADMLTSIKEFLPMRIHMDPSPLLSPVQDLLQNR